MPSDSPKIPDMSAPTYPAITKQAFGTVNGVRTDVTSVEFADKIMVTITQGGRLAQWVGPNEHQCVVRIELKRKTDTRTSRHVQPKLRRAPSTSKQ